MGENVVRKFLETILFVTQLFLTAFQQGLLNSYFQEYSRCIHQICWTPFGTTGLCWNIPSLHSYKKNPKPTI